MRLLTRRRVISLVLSILAMVVMWYVVRYYDLQTLRGDYISGWLLFGLFLFLMAFGIRKKFTVIPLGSAYTWAQLHIYLGLVAVFVYLLHVPGIVVTGAFEQTMGIIALLTMGTGILGIFLSRTIPPLMNRRGERIFMSRIRGHQAMLKREVESQVANAIHKGAGDYFFDFYQDQIAPYFLGIRHIPYHLIGSQRPYELWQSRFAVAGNYLSADAHSYLDELRELMNQKIDLDFQYVAQWVVKAWLVVHIALSYFLLILIPFHLLLVYSFREG